MKYKNRLIVPTLVTTGLLASTVVVNAEEVEQNEQYSQENTVEYSNENNTSETDLDFIESDEESPEDSDEEDEDSEEESEDEDSEEDSEEEAADEVEEDADVTDEEENAAETDGESDDLEEETQEDETEEVTEEEVDDAEVDDTVEEAASEVEESEVDSAEEEETSEDQPEEALTEDEDEESVEEAQVEEVPEEESEIEESEAVIETEENSEAPAEEEEVTEAQADEQEEDTAEEAPEEEETVKEQEEPEEEVDSEENTGADEETPADETASEDNSEAANDEPVEEIDSEESDAESSEAETEEESEENVTETDEAETEEDTYQYDSESLEQELENLSEEERAAFLEENADDIEVDEEMLDQLNEVVAAEHGIDLEANEVYSSDASTFSTMSMSQAITDINEYIAANDFDVAEIQYDLIDGLPQYAFESDYGNDPENGKVGQPSGVVLHDVGNDNSTIHGEISYMSENWENAFVHAFVDADNIIQVANTDYLAYGAGPVSNQTHLHVELVRHDNQHDFARSINNYADYIANLLYKYKLPVVSAEGTGEGTLWSHVEVSHSMGGTASPDPYEYFASHGYEYNDVISLIDSRYNDLYNKVTDPNIYMPTFEGDTENLGAAVTDQNRGIYESITDVRTNDASSLIGQDLRIVRSEIYNYEEYYLLENADGTEIGWMYAGDVMTSALDVEPEAPEEDDNNETPEPETPELQPEPEQPEPETPEPQPEQPDEDSGETPEPDDNDNENEGSDDNAAGSDDNAVETPDEDNTDGQESDSGTDTPSNDEYTDDNQESDSGSDDVPSENEDTDQGSDNESNETSEQDDTDNSPETDSGSTGTSGNDNQSSNDSVDEDSAEDNQNTDTDSEDTSNEGTGNTGSDDSSESDGGTTESTDSNVNAGSSENDTDEPTDENTESDVEEGREESADSLDAGEDGSTGEAPADNEDGEVYSSLEDPETGVRIYSESDELDGKSLVVTVLGSSDAIGAEHDLYDIHVLDENGSLYSLQNPVTVYLPAGGYVANVYYLGDIGETLEAVNFRTEDGYAVFEASDFSQYAVVYGGEDADNTTVDPVSGKKDTEGGETSEDRANEHPAVYTEDAGDSEDEAAAASDSGDGSADADENGSGEVKETESEVLPNTGVAEQRTTIFATILAALGLGFLVKRRKTTDK